MRDQDLKRIIRAYGNNAQIDVSMEEMSELTQSLIKHRRAVSSKEEGLIRLWADSIAEEIADVKIMVRQLEIIFDNENAVNEWIDYKIDRQIKRITGGNV